MADAWFAKFKRLFGCCGKERERRPGASASAVTFLEHLDTQSLDLQDDFSTPEEGVDILHNQSLNSCPAIPRAQPLESSPLPPRTETSLPPMSTINIQQDKVVQPCQHPLHRKSSEYSANSPPNPQSQLPGLLLTCPSTVSSVYPAPLLSPILPVLPRLDTQVQPQPQPHSQTQQFHPLQLHPRQLFYPSRPAPRPPRHPRKPLLISRSSSDEAVSPRSRSLPWRRTAFGAREVDGRDRDGAMSPLDGTGGTAEVEGKVMDTKRRLCISSPVPGSFEHVDGAFVGGDASCRKESC